MAAAKRNTARNLERALNSAGSYVSWSPLERREAGWVFRSTRQFPAEVVEQAIKKLGIDPDKPFPFHL